MHGQESQGGHSAPDVVVVVMVVMVVVVVVVVVWVGGRVLLS